MRKTEVYINYLSHEAPLMIQKNPETPVVEPRVPESSVYVPQVPETAHQITQEEMRLYGEALLALSMLI